MVEGGDELLRLLPPLRKTLAAQLKVGCWFLFRCSQR